MAELKEVFDMVTKQTEPDLDSWKEQEDRQRRSSRNRRIGGFAVAAAIVAFAVGAAIIAKPGRGGDATPASQPPVEGLTVTVVNVDSGAHSPFLDPNYPLPSGAGEFDFIFGRDMVTYSAPDGNGDSQVFVMNTDGSNQRQLTNGPQGATFLNPAWSPDGSMIAYESSVPEGGNEIFVVRIADGSSTRVTHEVRDPVDPTWVDATHIVYSMVNAGQSKYNAWIWNIDESTADAPSTRDIAIDVSSPDVSPDGTQMVFDSYHRPPGEVWLSVVDIDGAGVRMIQQVSSSGSYPKWSPDGARIAFVYDGNTYVYEVATRQARLVAPGLIVDWVDDQRVLIES